MTFLSEAAIFLAAAVIAVPVSKRLGLGSVLGYLMAGLIIGPWGLGFITNVMDILKFAEFGVVLLLFIIGLELQPSRLWTMRKQVFGLGTAQVAGSGLTLTTAGLFLGLPPTVAAIAGVTLALSSTAFALQILSEKNQLTTRHGRSGFALLLFQDIAVIPLIAIVPLLGAASANIEAGEVAVRVVTIIAVLAAFLIGGRFFLRYAFRLIAMTGLPEVFTAAALLIVIGAAVLMESVGISMALGAFLAGVLLADSEYRHELEANIDPFKGLLLGLFFIAVGMSVNIGLLLERPLVVLGLVAGLFVINGLILSTLARLNGLNTIGGLWIAATLSQGGEFGFVIFSMAFDAGIMSREIADLLILVVSLSMAATPLLVLAVEAYQKRMKSSAEERPADFPDQGNQVIIAGLGRFGQIVARILMAKGISVTALDANPGQVELLRRFGRTVYYGDASRLDVLRAAGAEHAEIFVLALEDEERSLTTARMVKKHFPHLKIYARARDRTHAYKLMDIGVDALERETFHSSLEISLQVLKGLGLSDFQAGKIVERFREHDVQQLYEHQASYQDEGAMIELAKQAIQELEMLLSKDAEEELDKDRL
ncbi:MAG: monovalent cation:proton antiporter-2 (CPA2) family protein [Sphingomonadales bacterium]|nr:monovalent cation:proton antiporter-2 (CPA2) family protein [Sphingomonadales bacterium]